MGLINIDGILLKKMIIAGANNLNKNKQLLDDLNVFPVPDGDTGTNMSLTVFAAAKEVDKLNTPNIYDVAKAASNGSLRGARGNSGVIVSQLFRGFADGLKNISVATTDDLANALMLSQETAYKAVMKPKEGTILTVAKELALKSTEATFDTDDIEVNFKTTYDHGMVTLEKTQEMLPELRQAGVVDAGGKGLMCFLEGALYALTFDGDIKIDMETSSTESSSSSIFANIDTKDIKFAYCTEFIVDVEKNVGKNEDEMKKFLSGIGDSIVVVEDGDIMKVHVHTNHPGKALEKALSFGSLTNMKIENMKEQHTNKLSFSGKKEAPLKVEEEKEVGIAVVTSGDGLSELFTELGVDIVVEGGQSMNPSTEDIIAAIEKVNAKKVIVLPNNKNIVLSANQAKELIDKKEVFVIPTKTIPQGITAIINYIPTNHVEENVQAMEDSMDNVKTGQITHAVRDTVLDGRKITQGDVLCMQEGDIVIVSKDIQEGAKQLVDKMITNGDEFITIYQGQDLEDGKAEEIANYINEKYEEAEVEIYKGNQPIYDYIISVE